MTKSEIVKAMNEQRAVKVDGHDGVQGMTAKFEDVEVAE